MPLIIAFEKNNRSICNLLIQNGADIDDDRKKLLKINNEKRSQNEFLREAIEINRQRREQNQHHTDFYRVAVNGSVEWIPRENIGHFISHAGYQPVSEAQLNNNANNADAWSHRDRYYEGDED